MSRQRVRVREQEEIDHPLQMFRGNYQQRYHTVDYQCLQKYDQDNEHFSMEAVKINEEEQERVISYNCIYRYGTHEVILKYDTSTEIWEIISVKCHSEEEKQLKTLLYRLQKHSWVDMWGALDGRVRHILEVFDRYFFELDRAKEAKQNKEKMSNSSLVFEKQNEPKCIGNESIELSSHRTPTSLIDSEDDKQQKNTVDQHQKRACGTQSSVPYVSFTSPLTVPVRRRRVIESIVLRVQRKKKTLEKLIDALKGKKPTMMFELGLEFLREYDGKFNYREGYTFVMPFRKKTWFLTIEQIKCVDCPVDDMGPRSVLILNYKGQETSVHV